MSAGRPWTDLGLAGIELEAMASFTLRGIAHVRELPSLRVAGAIAASLEELGYGG